MSPDRHVPVAPALSPTDKPSWQPRQLAMLHQLPELLRGLPFDVSNSSDPSVADPITYTEALARAEQGMDDRLWTALEPEYRLIVVTFQPWTRHPHQRERIRTLVRSLRSFTLHEHGSDSFQVFCMLPRPILLKLDYIHMSDDAARIAVEATTLGEFDLLPDVYALYPLRPLLPRYLSRFYSVAAEILARERHPERYNPLEIPTRHGWDTL